MTHEPAAPHYSSLAMPKDIVSARRAALGLTQTELARKVGIARNFVSMIESGTSRVPNERILQIADALEIDPIWFLEKCMLDDSRSPGANNLRSIAEFIFRPEILRCALDMKTRAMASLRVLPGRL